MSSTMKEPDDLIWHYTSADVFMEFMKDDSCLYATHYEFLNDAEEVRYGTKLCMHILREDSNLSRYSDDIEIMLGNSNIFLCCFSKQPDSLYQWRSYTPSGGFSIGFSQKEFEDILQDAWDNENAQYSTLLGLCNIFENEKAAEIDLSESEQKFIIENYDNNLIFNDFYAFFIDFCRYEFNTLKKEFQDFLQREYKRAQTMPQLYTDEYVAPLHTSCETIRDCLHKKIIAQMIDYISTLLKNPSFKFEEEVRIIYRSNAFLKKRLIYVGGKPRIPTHIRNLRDLIKEVYVSPNGSRARNRKLAEMFRDKYDLNFEIKESSSSFIGD